VALTAFGIVLLDPAYREGLAEIWLPVLKEPVSSAGSLGWPLAACLAVAGVFFVLVSVGCSNAVNLTDGLDGLAIGCVLITTAILGVVAYLAGHAEFASYLRIRHVVGAGELAVFCAALFGGSLVFLWHNAAPAEIYMGDVGALGLGGALGAVACLMRQPFLLAIVGGVFVVEAVSVILQVAYFKRTGGQAAVPDDAHPSPLPEEGLARDQGRGALLDPLAPLPACSGCSPSSCDERIPRCPPPPAHPGPPPSSARA
jgi:phospho-N-acetylmuramoyl-pentapeptide-transferase